MPCTPLTDSQFTVPPVSGTRPSVQLPNLNIPFPAIPLEDLNELFQTLEMILPPGTLKPSFEPQTLNSVYAGIKDLLDKFFPFLMLYKFILPILEMILCIIEILCSLINPFKIARALRRLFRVCLPDLLAMFPFFALILMIISLLLLLLALIEYLITRLLALIELILKNIILLARATSSLNNDSIIGIVQKIGDLLCILQNLFIIMAIFNVIIQIIKAILSLIFKIPPCDSSDGSSDGCCSPDICPSFLRDNTTITSNTGVFQYLNEVGISYAPSGAPPGFAPLISPIRPESWQFFDPNLPQDQAFINITEAFDLPAGAHTIFFPPGVNYTTDTSPSSVPYTINITFTYNPAQFGRTDPLGIRKVLIVNAIVAAPPTKGTIGYDGKTLFYPFNGTLNLIGGVVTELNGNLIYDSSGNPYNVNTFIHLPLNYLGTTLNPTDPFIFPDLEYTFTINHDILAALGLITIGCIPEVAADRNFINGTIGIQFNVNGQNLSEISSLLPDTNATQQCVAAAITTYRQNVSTDSTNAFQTAVLDCLNNLRSSTVTALTAAIKAGFDQYKSDFSLSTNIQFTTLPIIVSVSVNESSGSTVTPNLPADVAAIIAPEIKGEITFGTLSNFTYDGSQFYTANLTSKQAGNGNIRVEFNGNLISMLNNPTSIDSTPSVTPKVLTYTFVDAPALPVAGDGVPHRDEGDVAREGN